MLIINAKKAVAKQKIVSVLKLKVLSLTHQTNLIFIHLNTKYFFIDNFHFENTYTFLLLLNLTATPQKQRGTYVRLSQS